MFDPTQYITKIKGKDYLPVAARIAWFRDAHPLGAIVTDLVQIDPYPVCRASINVEGVVIATAYGSAQPKQGSVYAGREIEKSETAAIGRALAAAGFGTQFVDEGEFDDTPQQRKPQKPAPQSSGMTEEEVRTLHAYATGKLKMSTDEILAALNVTRYGEFRGTYREALKTVDDAYKTKDAF